MKQNHYLLISLPLMASILLSNGVCADDTEIFFNENALNNTEEFQPNVLFIFDTSGSMSGQINTTEAYDPSTNYCGNTCNNNIYVYNTDYNYLGFSISPDRNSCQSMIDHIANTPASPVYTGRAGEWREIFFLGDRWRTVTNSSRTVECQEDAGIHGVDSSSTDIYAANGFRGPYTSSASDAISWSSYYINDQIYVSSNYHFYLQTAASVTRVKMDVMKEAAIDLVNGFDGLNFGLMRFDGSQGGYVKHHFSDIQNDRAEIINNINELTASGNTPLSETLWEAHKYFLGGSVEYGTNSNRDPAAISGTNYNSLAANSSSACQNNYVVYLTDGQPYSDNGRDSTIRNLTNTNCAHSDGANDANNTCLDELSGYMASFDYNDSVEGIQNAVTHTIGFNIDMDLLEQTAINGNGTYHTANSSEELKSAFNQIIIDILSKSTTFTAPAVSVNAYNSLQHRNELYYATFEPNNSPRWVGNVKKYRINSDGDVLDANNRIATESETSYFKDTAESYWGGITDGPVVRKGGASSQLNNARTIYTVAGDATASNIILNTTENIIALDNNDISDTRYGFDPSAFPDQASLDTARENLIKWIIGIDVNDDDNDNDTTDSNNFMADPLHSRPIVVTYDGDISDPDNVVLEDIMFATTNEGAFHAIDTSNGQEIFAFIPQDLLPNQLDYFINDPDGTRRYGLDGPMTVWRQESNDEDIRIESGDGDHVYAYFGMRRGGNNYYAMDVTNKNSPRLLWTIFGGSEGFQDMGQTWSRPILRQVNWDCDNNGENCITKNVLFFSGGYDTIHDNATAPTTGDQGAAIYMVDAETGELLWSAGNKNSDDTHDLELPMNNSIPGDVTVADMDGDGSVDILFAVDIQGHVWRIDFNSKTTSASDFAQDGNGKDTGAEIADLSGGQNEFRRFYTGPTVSLSQKRGRKPFFVLTMGTGYTAHPKNTDTVDRIYAVFEYSIYRAPRDFSGNINYTKINNSSLLDLTDPANGPADPNIHTHGFYKDGTATGEKFLRPALTIFGLTFYTSYLPEGNDSDTNASCGTEYLGTGRIYAMDFVTGKTAYTSEYIDLKHPGIPPEPVVLFIADPVNGGTKPILCVGTACFSPEDEENPMDLVTTKILYWRENTQ